MPLNRNDSPVLLFDGVCNLCNGFVRFIIKRDVKEKFRFASLQSDAGKALLETFNLSQEKMESLVLVYENECFQKSTAVLKICKEFGGPWRIFYGFIILPKSIRDFFYSLVAKTRYKVFGKLNTCMLPTPDIKKRFLE